MSSLSRSALATDITSKVYTNISRLIKGNTVRDRMLNMVDSTLNKTDDADMPGGYLSINVSGIADASFIRKSSPTGQFLSDDGTWQTITVGDFIPRAGTSLGSPILGLLEYGGASDSTALAGLDSFYIGSGDVLDLDNWSYGSRVYFGGPVAGKTATLSLTGPITVLQNRSGAARITTTMNANVSGSFHQVQVNNGTNNSDFTINATGQIDLSSSDASFSGILGGADYSAHYTGFNFVQKVFTDASYAPIVSGGYMPISGGTFTGSITLNSDAINPLQPVSFQQAVALLAGYEQLQKGYDASTNLFPTASDTLPVVGMVKKGMSWYVTVAGTLGGLSVALGDEIIALVDAPGQTASKWLCISHTIGYAPVSNVLNSGNIFVGNASNVAAGATLTLNATSGSFSLSNAGVLTFPDASTSVRGLLNSTDWNTFNGKQNALGYTPYDSANPSNYIAKTALSATAPLSYNNTTGLFSIAAATTSTNGYLTATNWNTFNNKQAALSGTGFVKSTGGTISYDTSTYLTTSAAGTTYVPYTGANAAIDLGTQTLTTTGIITVGSTTVSSYLKVLGDNTGTNFDVFIGAKRYPRFTLTDTVAGGSSFSFWNLGGQFRMGTNSGNFNSSTFVVYSGDAADILFNGNLQIGPYAAGVLTTPRDFNMTGGRPNSNLVPGKFTVQGFGAFVGSTNVNGGSLILASGLATGNGTSSILFQTAGGGSTGTVDSNPVTRASIDSLGNFSLLTLGAGLSVKSGINGRAGRATLSAGTITVANTNITSNSIILMDAVGIASGYLNYTTSVGVGFTINSSLITDTRVVSYLIVELS